DLHVIETENRLARKIGFDTKLSHEGLGVGISENKTLGFNNLGYLEIDNQAKFEPLLFLKGLIEKCVEMGVGFYEETEIEKYCCKNPTKVTSTQGFTVSADYAVIATHYPSNGMFQM